MDKYLELGIETLMMLTILVPITGLTIPVSVLVYKNCELKFMFSVSVPTGI